MHTHKRNNNTSYKSYTGSGIILIEMYDNHAGKREPAVILFKNRHMNAYADLGGHIDKQDVASGKPLESAARREAFEESAGLIKIHHFKHLPSVKYNNYNCYLAQIKSELLYSKDFHSNLKIILKSNLPYSFRETTDVARFYLSDLIKSGLMSVKGDMPTIDARGNVALITGRSKGILREAIISGALYGVFNDVHKFKKKTIILNNNKLVTLSDK